MEPQNGDGERRVALWIVDHIRSAKTIEWIDPDTPLLSVLRLEDVDRNAIGLRL